MDRSSGPNEALARQELARRAQSFEPDRLAKRRSRVSSFEEGSTVNYSHSSHQANAIVAITIPQAFQNAVKARGDRAYIVRPDGETITLGQFYDLASAVAKSLLKLGVKRFQSVIIAAKNDVPWFAASVGTVFAGAVTVGVNLSASGANFCYIAKHSSAKVIVADDSSLVLKLINGAEELRNLVLVLTSNEEAEVARGMEELSPLNKILSWEEFLVYGEDLEESALAVAITTQRPEQCCALLYTSGTSNLPKAVMLSHDNITWTVRVIGTTLRLDGDDVGLSYLPLSHISANLIDIHGAAHLGLTMHLVPDAATNPNAFIEALRQFEPTFLIGVPSIWEGLHQALNKIIQDKSRLSQKFATMAIDIGAKAANNVNAKRKPWNFSLANRVVLKRVVKQLGLSNCRLCMNVGASLRDDTKEFFAALHIPILEVYGLTETTGPATISTPWLNCSGTVGKPLNGIECIVHNPSSTGEGEILLRGRNVFAGYLGDEEATQKAVDSGGFFHTGDLGRISSNGHVYITGRIKELVVLKDGHNISPVPVENEIRSAIPGVSNAMVVGDGRHSIVCILSLNEQIDSDGEPTGKLEGNSALVNLRVTTIADARVDSDWHEYLSRWISEVNETIADLTDHHEIRHYVVARKDFTYKGGELTALGKMRRRIIQEMYEEELDAIYRREDEELDLDQLTPSEWARKNKKKASKTK